MFLRIIATISITRGFSAKRQRFLRTAKYTQINFPRPRFPGCGGARAHLIPYIYNELSYRAKEKLSSTFQGGVTQRDRTYYRGYNFIEKLARALFRSLRAGGGYNRDFSRRNIVNVAQHFLKSRRNEFLSEIT